VLIMSFQAPGRAGPLNGSIVPGPHVARIPAMVACVGAESRDLLAQLVRQSSYLCVPKTVRA
jgi:hypothetical protein